MDDNESIKAENMIYIFHKTKTMSTPCAQQHAIKCLPLIKSFDDLLPQSPNYIAFFKAIMQILPLMFSQPTVYKSPPDKVVKKSNDKLKERNCGG